MEVLEIVMEIQVQLLKDLLKYLQNTMISFVNIILF
jgi:hypothetical protein